MSADLGSRAVCGTTWQSSSSSSEVCIQNTIHNREAMADRRGSSEVIDAICIVSDQSEGLSALFCRLSSSQRCGTNPYNTPRMPFAPIPAHTFTRDGYLEPSKLAAETFGSGREVHSRAITCLAVASTRCKNISNSHPHTRSSHISYTMQAAK